MNRCQSELPLSVVDHRDWMIPSPMRSERRRTAAERWQVHRSVVTLSQTLDIRRNNRRQGEQA